MPTTIPTHPDANVLTEGFRTALHRFPENNPAVADRRYETMRALSPRNHLQEWFSDDIALTQIRLDRVARIERHQRDQSALRAEFFWDDDRRLLAEDLGARLPRDPARTVKKLRATPQGCDWMIERWGWLRGIVDAGQAWNEVHRSLAFDLLGIAPGFREGNNADRLSDAAQLVRDEVAALEAQKVRVAEADALERSLAMADMADPNTVEFRRLRRYEGSLLRRMRWSMDQLELMPKYAEPYFEVFDPRAADRPITPTVMPAPPPPPQPDPGPEPEPVVSAPAPIAAPIPTPTVPTPKRPSRPDLDKLRAQSRKRIRQRHEDRVDR